jgi:hypothetical protein
VKPVALPADGVVARTSATAEVLVLLWCAPFAVLAMWLLAQEFRNADGNLLLTLVMFAVLLPSAIGIAGAAWRLIDRRPLARVGAEGIHFHPTIGPALAEWSEISGISYATRPSRSRRTIHYVAVNLFDPYWGYAAPLRSIFVRIDYGRNRSEAQVMAATLEHRRRAARLSE